MGKSKKKQKQRTSNEGSSGIFGAKPAPNLDTLIEEAEAAIDSFSYEEAIPKLKDVLKFEQNHTKAAEMLSGIYIELCNYDEAQDLLKHCISVSPDIGFSKYFSMGQLTDGEESLSFYNKGIQVLQKSLKMLKISTHRRTKVKTFGRVLSEAYCSVAGEFI
ncbi:putative assembly chaperone of rpl4 [Caerostris extrusa]|uniref:Assembly chaperone of rpl4 n=1 Tax=Caerostris extrusa TaxID=172846 RepID=A0AAV4XD66_CAEEX|nr:putative assembly chaperone of rpl4 [Caerostris extrusa]